MTTVSEKSEAINAAKAIMGNGSMDSCQKELKQGCRLCCRTGAFLFEGEILDEVPDGVRVIGSKVINCLGKTGCLFQADKKPLICQMSPVVNPVIYPDGTVTAEITYPFGRCPAKVSKEFNKKVAQALIVLMGKNVWHPLSQTTIGKLSGEEMAEIVRTINNYKSHK